MIKKQSVGIWFNIIVAVLTIVSVIVYGVNISGDGYFQNASVGNLVAYCVIAVIMLVAVIVLAQPKFTGTAALVTEIISGGARGVDSCAREYANRKGIHLTEYLPNYKKYGRGAPLRRNITIVENADLVLAFWDGQSHGTKHVIDHCRKSGVPVQVILCPETTI